MSHFTVLVTKIDQENVYIQLEPFSEYTYCDSYLSKTKRELIELAKTNLESVMDSYTKHIQNPKKFPYFDWMQGLKNSSEWNDETLYRWFIFTFLGLKNDSREWIDSEGNLMSSFNPNGKYDWCRVGGRWTGYFASKNGGILGSYSAFDETPRKGYYDIVCVKDIDWKKMDKDLKNERAERFDAELLLPEDRRFLYDRRYRKGMTKKEYIDLPFSHATFAVVHNGEWYEKSRAGWWGMAPNEKEEAEWESTFYSIIKSLNPDDRVAIVDCHV